MVLDQLTHYNRNLSPMPGSPSNGLHTHQISDKMSFSATAQLNESLLVPNRTSAYSRASYADDQGGIGSLVLPDTPEEQKETPDETAKEIEDILKRKEVLEKVSATGSVNHLRQILKNLAKSKRRNGMLGSENIAFEDEEDLDFDEIQDHLVRAYDGAQRKTASRVFKYVGKTQKSEKELLLKDVLKRSVGTEVPLCFIAF